MPGYDGTGPEGQGARTGRGLGNCPPANKGNQLPPQKGGARPRWGWRSNQSQGFGRGGTGYRRGLRRGRP